MKSSKVISCYFYYQEVNEEEGKRNLAIHEITETETKILNVI